MSVAPVKRREKRFVEVRESGPLRPCPNECESNYREFTTSETKFMGQATGLSQLVEFFSSGNGAQAV